MGYKQVSFRGQVYYGKHMLVHGVGCSSTILSVDGIREWVSGLCDRIGMQRFGDCVAARFGEGEEVGISAFQLIYTSNIAIHTNDAHRELYLDVFSCKDYGEKLVLDEVRNYFSPEELTYEVLYRR